MFKIIGKILIILAVAGMVCGGLYAYVNSSGQNLAAGEGSGFHGDRATLTRPQGSALDGVERGSGERGGHDEFSLTRGIAGLARNTALLAGIMLAVILIQKAWRLIFHRRPTTTPASTE